MVLKKENSAAYHEYDAAIATLQHHKHQLVDISPLKLASMLDEMFDATAKIADTWIEQDIINRGLDPNHWDAATTILTGPCVTLRLIELYQQTLKAIANKGKPTLPSRTTQLPNGQTSIRVFPNGLYDRVLFNRFSADVWLSPNHTLD